MATKKTALRENLYLPAKEAEAVRNFACETRLTNARAMKLLILAGLEARREGSLEDRFQRLRAETLIRDREMLGLMSEVVLAVRFLAESEKPGMEKRLKELRVNALAALLEKIDRNEKAL